MAQFKKVGGKDPKTGKEHTVLIEGKLLNRVQFDLVQAMIKAAGTAMLSRAQLREYHFQVAKRKSSPYFISKNVDAKTKNRGIYNLGVFKLSAAAAKEPATKPGKKVVAKKVAAKKAAAPAKKVAAPKTKKEKKVPAKGKGAPVEAPAHQQSEAPAMA